MWHSLYTVPALATFAYLKSCNKEISLVYLHCPPLVINLNYCIFLCHHWQYCPFTHWCHKNFTCISNLSPLYTQARDMITWAHASASAALHKSMLSWENCSQVGVESPPALGNKKGIIHHIYTLAQLSFHTFSCSKQPISWAGYVNTRGQTKGNGVWIPLVLMAALWQGCYFFWVIRTSEFQVLML